MPFDPQTFKSQFPLFSQTENQSLIYLDNASTTQKPQCVIDAITHFYLHHNGNAQRASHRLARSATQVVENTRSLACDFLGAENNTQVVFTSGATAGLNIIAHGLQTYCQQGDEILISDGEHHANLLPWQRLAEQARCQLRFFSLAKNAKVHSLVTENTRIITLSAASNVLGVLNDLSWIKTIKQQFPRVIIVIDASQMAAHIPLQVEQWQCDFLVCSAHKFYGPTGIGLLYGRTEWLQKMPPFMVGGEMVDKVECNASCFVSSVERFEAGTSSTSAIAGLSACLSFWKAQDRAAMREYEKKLTAYLYQQLDALCRECKTLQVISPQKNNVGIATLVATNAQVSLSDLAHWLDEHDIAVRVGDHCAQTLWQSLSVVYGANKGLRISIAAYNTYNDVDALITAVHGFFNHCSTTVDALNSQHDRNGDIKDDLSLLNPEDLLAATSWQKRFKMLQQWGACIAQKPTLRQDQYLVKGCETAVWLRHYQQGEQHYFIVDSDSSVIKGLAALLLVWFNGQTSAAIQSLSIEEKYQQLGLQKHLSPSRMNGFMALLNAIIKYV